MKKAEMANPRLTDSTLYVVAPPYWCSSTAKVRDLSS